MGCPKHNEGGGRIRSGRGYLYRPVVNYKAAFLSREQVSFPQLSSSTVSANQPDLPKRPRVGDFWASPAERPTAQYRLRS
jgi:hypothetical protein